MNLGRPKLEQKTCQQVQKRSYILTYYSLKTERTFHDSPGLPPVNQFIYLRYPTAGTIILIRQRMFKAEHIIVKSTRTFWPQGMDVTLVSQSGKNGSSRFQQNFEQSHLNSFSDRLRLVVSLLVLLLVLVSAKTSKTVQPHSYQPLKGGQGFMIISPPFQESQGCHCHCQYDPTLISSFVLLPSPVALSFLSFSAFGPFVCFVCFIA